MTIAPTIRLLTFRKVVIIKINLTWMNNLDKVFMRIGTLELDNMMNKFENWHKYINN